MTYRFGKLPAKSDYRTLRFGDYVAADLAVPPPAFGVLSAIYEKLGVHDPASLFPMDGNDRYGDCTIAALCHAITVYRGMLGTKKIPSAAWCEKTYFHLTGGVDSGLGELDVLNYWRTTSADSDGRLLGYVKVNPHNHLHVTQAISLFGGLYIGFQCQQNVLDEFQAHQPWQPGRLTNDGHAVYVVGYDPTGIQCLTWGATQGGSWAWWDECVEEAYCLLPHEAQAPGFAPGLDLAALQADLNAVAN